VLQRAKLVDLLCGWRLLLCRGCRHTMLAAPTICIPTPVAGVPEVVFAASAGAEGN